MYTYVHDTVSINMFIGLLLKLIDSPRTHVYYILHQSRLITNASSIYRKYWEGALKLTATTLLHVLALK